jgi:hypothetical protein
MGSVPPNLAVFVGPDVAGSHRWYWADAPIHPRRKVTIAGPFETKEKAVQNAAEMLTARPTPNAELPKHRPNSLYSTGVRMPRRGQPRARTTVKRLDFWARVRAECSTLPAMRMRGTGSAARLMSSEFLPRPLLPAPQRDG